MTLNLYFHPFSYLMVFEEFLQLLQLKPKQQKQSIRTMKQNMYLQDPNEYIRSLSQVRRSIQKNVFLKLNSSSNHISSQIQRQIKQNFDRYKKNILINQRIQLSKQYQLSEDHKRKQTLQEMIENKIQISKQTRQKRKQQSVQKKINQRLMKEAIINSKKQQLRKQNLQKSIGIIQKIQEKTGNYNRTPIKFKILEENIKSSRARLKVETSFNTLKRSMSESQLPKIGKKSGFIVTEPEYGEKIGQLSAQEMVKGLREMPNMKKSKSLREIKKKSPNNEEEILQKLIEQNQKDQYYNYLLKNSLSYQASNHSRLKEVKSAIHEYLKGPNPVRS